MTSELFSSLRCLHCAIWLIDQFLHQPPQVYRRSLSCHHFVITDARAAQGLLLSLHRGQPQTADSARLPDIRWRVARLALSPSMKRKSTRLELMQLCRRGVLGAQYFTQRHLRHHLPRRVDRGDVAAQFAEHPRFALVQHWTDGEIRLHHQPQLISESSGLVWVSVSPTSSLKSRRHLSRRHSSCPDQSAAAVSTASSQ